MNIHRILEMSKTEMVTVLEKFWLNREAFEKASV